MREKRKTKKRAGAGFQRIIVWLTAVSMVWGAAGMAGCGRENGNGNKSMVIRNEAAETTDMGSTDGALEEPDKEKVMGRYLEQTDDSLKGEVGTGSDIVQMEDGSLVIMSGNTGKWVSADNGTTWERERMAWHEEMMAAKVWVMNTAVSKDGYVAVIYSGGEERGGEENTAEADTEIAEKAEEEESGSVSFHPSYGIASPDGDFKKLEIPYREHEYINFLAFSEDGRLFGSALGGRIYEIDKETGAVEELLELSGSVYYIAEKENKLILAGGDGVTVWDLEAGVKIEDTVINDFLHEQMGTYINYGTEGVQPVLFLPGDEGILYLAFEKGIYRHVIGGNMIEQVVEGSLTSLNDPSCEISDGLLLENDVFVLLRSNGGIMKYTYDPDTPAVPEVQLRAYSLRDNQQLKKVIAAFGAEHPEVYIRYEAGIEENSAMTRDDALKKLNTEIAAGRGPDIFMLDDMPVSSYIEKGVLLDLASFLENKTEDKYFTNIIRAFGTEEGIYAVPVQFQIGLVVGKQEEIKRIDSLEAMAGMAEAYRKEKTEGTVLGIRSEDEMLHMLLPVCEPAWKDENGRIDREALTEFYTLAKRIWDAEEEGISEDVKEEYKRWTEERKIAGVSDERTREYQMGISGKEIGWLTGDRELAAGIMSDSSGFNIIISCFKTQGKEDGGFAAYSGQAEKVFVPNGLMGISRTSEYQEIAVGLLEKMLDDDGWSGMPVNKEKWGESFRRYASEDGSCYASMGGSGADGKERYHLDIYPASEEEIARLMEIAEEGNTPYVKDSMLEDAVCKAGLKVLRGEISASAGAEEVIQRMAVYLAE